MRCNYFRLGSDPDKLFSYDTFMSEMNKYGKYAAIVGTLLLPLLGADVNAIPNLDEITANSDVQAFAMSEESQIVFDKNVKDFVGDLVEFGYI